MNNSPEINLSPLELRTSELIKDVEALRHVLGETLPHKMRHFEALSKLQAEMLSKHFNQGLRNVFDLTQVRPSYPSPEQELRRNGLIHENMIVLGQLGSLSASELPFLITLYKSLIERVETLDDTTDLFFGAIVMVCRYETIWGKKFDIQDTLRELLERCFELAYRRGADDEYIDLICYKLGEVLEQYTSISAVFVQEIFWEARFRERALGPLEILEIAMFFRDHGIMNWREKVSYYLERALKTAEILNIPTTTLQDLWDNWQQELVIENSKNN